MPARSVARSERRGATGPKAAGAKPDGGAYGRFDARARAERRDMRQLLELTCAVEAPTCGVARAALTERLRGQVTGPVLDIARLVITELVANAVRHSRAAADENVVVRMLVGTHVLRLEVDDPGGGGMVRRRAPGINAGGGLGLNLVESLSERWAAERVPGGRTRVWADVALDQSRGASPFPPIQGEELALKPWRQRGPAQDPHHRGLERAHKTVTGRLEAAPPGAPRSGSA